VSANELGIAKIVIGIAWSVFMWWYARRRGYNPWCWFLSAGLIGLLVLEFMPSPTAEGDAERAAKLRKRGNWVGGILAALTLVLVMIRAFTMPH